MSRASRSRKAQLSFRKCCIYRLLFGRVAPFASPSALQAPILDRGADSGGDAGYRSWHAKVHGDLRDFCHCVPVHLNCTEVASLVAYWTFVTLDESKSTLNLPVVELYWMISLSDATKLPQAFIVLIVVNVPIFVAGVIGLLIVLAVEPSVDT